MVFSGSLDTDTFTYALVTPSGNYPYVYTGSWNGLTINSSLQVSFSDQNEGSFNREIYRGSAFGADELWWESENPLLRPIRIAEDGSLYVYAESTITKGRDMGQRRYQFYHLLSPTERTPLSDPETDGNAYEVGQPYRTVSSAPVGEEEIIFGTDNQGIQIYKPKFGSRFVLDLQVPEASSLNVGAGNTAGPFICGPFNQSEGIESSPDEYYGGYIAYWVIREADSVNFLRSYILTPSQ